MRLLLVEDEDDLASAVTAALSARGFLVDTAGSVDETYAALAQVSYKAVILDRRLPDGDGLDILPSIRKLPARPGVLVLTALGDLEDTVSGLNAGADDYLSKPFETVELVARLQALLRRPAFSGDPIIEVGGLAYDVLHREASVWGTPMALPRRELLLLDALVRRAGRAVSREHLDEAVYGFSDEVQTEALKPHVSRLRRKLKDHKAGVAILALRGIGYMIREDN